MRPKSARPFSNAVFWHAHTNAHALCGEQASIIPTWCSAQKGKAPETEEAKKAAEVAHSMLDAGELPNESNPNVDVAMDTIGEIEAKLPWLFEPAK
eukprot:SAG11_NODE_2421_length_3380_cov_2.614752_3_plen_96_part_00